MAKMPKQCLVDFLSDGLVNKDCASVSTLMTVGTVGMG